MVEWALSFVRRSSQASPRPILSVAPRAAVCSTQANSTALMLHSLVLASAGLYACSQGGDVLVGLLLRYLALGRLCLLFFVGRPRRASGM